MDNKLEKTVDKTIEALARIGRFIEKYGDQLDKKQISRISESLQDLRIKIDKR